MSFGRGNWARNDCNTCPSKNVNYVTIALLGSGFIIMAVVTLLQNTSNHHQANFFVMAKAKSKFKNNLAARLKRKREAKAAAAAGGEAVGTAVASWTPPSLAQCRYHSREQCRSRTVPLVHSCTEDSYTVNPNLFNIRC